MRRESRPRGFGSAASIRDETTTVAASSTSEPLPVKRKSRTASAASGGVRREGLVPDLTGVAPPRELAAVLAPSRAEATVLKAAPPSSRSLVRVRPGARSSESSLTPPRRHPSSVESMAGRFAAWKRAQASLRTRPRSLWALMLLTAGLRDDLPNSVPPNHVERPRSCATFHVLEVFFIDRPLTGGRLISPLFASSQTTSHWPVCLPLRQKARHGAEACRLGGL